MHESRSDDKAPLLAAKKPGLFSRLRTRLFGETKKSSSLSQSPSEDTETMPSLATTESIRRALNSKSQNEAAAINRKRASDANASTQSRQLQNQDPQLQSSLQRDSQSSSSALATNPAKSAISNEAPKDGRSSDAKANTFFSSVPEGEPISVVKVHVEEEQKKQIPE